MKWAKYTVLRNLSEISTVTLNNFEFFLSNFLFFAVLSRKPHYSPLITEQIIFLITDLMICPLANQSAQSSEEMYSSVKISVFLHLIETKILFHACQHCQHKTSLSHQKAVDTFQGNSVSAKVVTAI